MAVGLVSMALALGLSPPAEGSLVARVTGVELVHLVAHSVLYGSLAAALAAWWFPAESLVESRRARVRRAAWAALCFGAIAGAQELAQAVTRARLPAGEELFDLGVDVAAATLGLIAWSRFDRRRPVPVARALGVLLHPGLVGPAGVFALTWAALRSARVALAWTALATLAVLPVAAVWAVGLWRGWYSDRDLSVREERSGFLAAALAVAALVALGARLAHAPAVVLSLTLAGLVAAGLVAAATAAGLKVSGHAAVPVGVVTLLEAASHRGLWPFAVAAVAVSWARVREGRHTPREVLAGWGIAGASGLLVRCVV